MSTLARLGGDFTNNGLALSPHASDVYFTLIPAGRSSNLLIERVATSTRKRSLVAHGWEPSLSPNGRLLAYQSYRGRSESVAVLDLASGRVRLVNVDAALGHDHVLLEVPPGWTRDGSALVLPVGSLARRVSRPPQARAETSPHSAPPVVRLIMVSVTANRPLAARRIIVTGLQATPNLLAPDALARDTVTAASLGPRGDGLLDEIHLTPSGAAACRLLSIPNAQVLAFDPTGQRLIYIAGQRPPVLWRATINHGRLTDRQRLQQDHSLGAIAW